MEIFLKNLGDYRHKLVLGETLIKLWKHKKHKKTNNYTKKFINHMAKKDHK